MTVNHRLKGEVQVVGDLDVAGPSVFNGTLDFNSARLLNGAAGTKAAPAALALNERLNPYRRTRINFTNLVVSVTAALDYGSALLFTYPNSNVLFLGAVVDLTAVEDGTGITDVTAVDFALGTVPLASTTFANAGEQDMVAEGDVAAGGRMEGVTSDSLDTKMLAAAADNEVYINVQATISADGSVTLSGYVDVVYLDLGAPDGVA